MNVFGNFVDWLDEKVHNVWQLLVYGTIPFGIIVLVRVIWKI